MKLNTEQHDTLKARAIKREKIQKAVEYINTYDIFNKKQRITKCM